MKMSLLALLAAASIASAGEPYTRKYDWREDHRQQAIQAQLDQIERQLRLQRQQQREAEMERHYQAERDFTFRSIFGK